MQTPSLEQKIAQMLIIGLEGHEITDGNPIIRDIENARIGGVILFDYNPKSNTFDKNIKSPQQVKELNESLQLLNQTVTNLPLLISVDYEGGTGDTDLTKGKFGVNRLKEVYGFVKTQDLQTLNEQSEENIKKQAIDMAMTLKECGFNLNLAPVVDLNTNPLCPVIGKIHRAFDKNPDVVCAKSKIFADVFREHNLLFAYKHFPGHGSATTDTHLGFSDVSDTWSDEELIPYQHLAESNNPYACVLTCHVVHKNIDPSGLPASLSHLINTQLLKESIGFKGLVITDDLQMSAIWDHYDLKDILKLSINAGNDLLIFGNQCQFTPDIAARCIEKVTNLVRSGEIMESRIDESYHKIINAKSII